MNKTISFFNDINKKDFAYDINLTKLVSLNDFNSISSYLAMFPVELPLYFIQKYTKEGDIVMDNFSGRGTTAYASRKIKRNFIGNDLNPYAYVLTKSKLVRKFSIKKVIKRIKELEQKYINYYFYEDLKKEDFDELKVFYSDFTLKQLIFLKNQIGINWKNNKDNLILALSLGLMHGPIKKDGSTIYVSVSMPNTISMSSNYVRNYSKKNNLLKPDINVFENLIKRLKIKWEDFLSEDYKSNFKYWNSIEKLTFIKNKSVDLVFTSPPYLSVVDYTKSNWLKLWLLGYDRKSLKKNIKLSDSLNLEEYKKFIKNYLINIYSKLKDNAKVCLIVGDVYNLQLIENVWEEIKDEVPYSFINIGIDKNVDKNKISNLLNSRKGNATKIDKILVLEKK